jgi:hypothetical protein
LPDCATGRILPDDQPDIVFARIGALIDDLGCGLAVNGQERVECGPERPIRAAGEVRKLPQEFPTSRGNWRDWVRKTPTESSWGFDIGGVGVNLKKLYKPHEYLVTYSNSVFAPRFAFAIPLLFLISEHARLHADNLEKLRSGADIIPFHRQAEVYFFDAITRALHGA